MGNKLSKELLRKITFYIPDNIYFSDSIKEDNVLDSASEISSTINTLVDQTCKVQYEILKKLSIIHGLSYILPHLDHWQQKGFFDLALIVIKNRLLKNTEFGQKLMQGIIESRVDFLDIYMTRVIRENGNSDFTELKWQHPNFIQFYQASMLQAKQDMHIVAPFWISNAINTAPVLPEFGLYAYGEFNFEYKPLISKLTETYVRNLALSLQNYVKKSDHAYGATLVLKGRIPYIFLNWMRGKSPLDPSEIPDVEIVYAIPVIHKDEISDKEYWFTLKQGSEYRLKKSNSKFIGLSKKLNKFHKKWDELRSYVVIDELIKESSYESDSYRSYVNHFWSKLYSFIKPLRQSPKKELDESVSSEKLVKYTIELYKKELEKEASSKNKFRSEKAKRILEDFSSISDLEQKILSLVKQTEYIEDDKLFYLDWNHIIYDQIKSKDYSKTAQDISIITPAFLDEKNDFFIFHRDPCFIRLDKTAEGLVKISVSKIPTIIYSKKTEIQILDYALFNVVLLASQFSLSKQSMEGLWKSLLNKINRSNYKYLYWFYEEYTKRNEDDSSSISQLFKDFDSQEIMCVFKVSVHTLMQTLKEALDQKREQSTGKINLEPQSLSIAGLFGDSSEDGEAEGIDQISNNQENFLEQPDSSIKEPVQNIQDIVGIIENEQLGGITTLVYIKNKISFAGDQYFKLNEVEQLSKLLGNNQNIYIYFFNYLLRESNLVKFIYVIKSNEEIKVAREKMGLTNDPNRPTHSELANGQGIKAAGELIFQKFSDGKWYLILINNGSGHYRPPALESLPLAKSAIIKKLNAEIAISRVKTLNSLKPGMTLASGMDDYESDVLYFDPSLTEFDQNAMEMVDHNANLRRIEKCVISTQLSSLTQKIFQIYDMRFFFWLISSEKINFLGDVSALSHIHSSNLDIQLKNFGTIYLLSEHSHLLYHKKNIDTLIEVINTEDVYYNIIFCLERKQHGNNLGMADVAALASHLYQGNTLPAHLQQLPIYNDALLYNAAKTKGIEVIGIEGKGLAYSKESPYYHQAREEYMAEQLVAITKLGKNAIVLVGSAHISNLIKLLGEQGFRVDYSDISLGHNLITLKSDQAVFFRELLLPRVSTELVTIINYEHSEETNSQIRTPNFEIKAGQTYVFFSYLYKFAEQLDLNWQLQKLIYFKDLWRYESIKTKYGILTSFDVFRETDSNFRKSVLLKLHPDKNRDKQDCNDDFIFISNLREEFNRPLNAQKLIEEKIQEIQPIIYKVGMGFKILDTAIDGIRLIHEPTIEHVKKVTIESTYVYSMYSGVNGYSSVISGADILCKIYQGEYLQAFNQATTTISYMLIPTMIGYASVPYLGFIYGITMTAYTGYSAVTNAYSLYSEYNAENHGLKSAVAYKALFETLSNSPIQKVYDFVYVSKKYEVKINNMNLGTEQFQIKQQLETKGEFSQKLYKYIYTTMLEEKYTLLNKVVQGSITQEEAEILKAKHIKITFENVVYDHCMEIKRVEEDVHIDTEHYYCYNTEQQILDHIMIGENNDIEKIGSL